MITEVANQLNSSYLGRCCSLPLLEKNCVVVLSFIQILYRVRDLYHFVKGILQLESWCSFVCKVVALHKKHFFDAGRLLYLPWHAMGEHFVPGFVNIDKTIQVEIYHASAAQVLGRSGHTAWQKA